VATTAVTLIMVVSASAHGVVSHPSRFGWSWDTAPDVLAEDVEAATDAAARTPGIAGMGELAYGAVAVEGAPVPAAAFRAHAGTVGLTYVGGRSPSGPGEVAVSLGYARHHGTQIGDVIRVDDPEGGRPTPFTVVGEVVAPPVDGDRRDLVFDFDVLPRVATSEPSGYPLFAYAPDADAATIDAALDRLGFKITPGSRPQTPGEVQQFEVARPAARLLVGVLAVIGALGLVHVLAITVRRRRGDLGVLQALGFRRRDVRRTLVWQAVSSTVIGVAIGMVVGVAAGRVLWSAAVASIGILDQPSTPWAALTAVVVVALAGALVLSLPPGWYAARRHLATSLRAE